MKTTTAWRLPRRRAALGATLTVALVAVGASIASASGPGDSQTPATPIPSASADSASGDTASTFLVEDPVSGVHFEVVVAQADPNLGRFIATIPGVGLIESNQPATISVNADHTDSVAYSGAGSLDATAQLDPEFGFNYHPSGDTPSAATLQLSGVVDPARESATLDLVVNGTDHKFSTSTTVPAANQTIAAVLGALNANDWTQLYALADIQTHRALTAQQYAASGAGSGTFSHAVVNGAITYQTSQADVHSAQVAIAATLTPPNGSPASARGFIDLIYAGGSWSLYSLTDPYTPGTAAATCTLCVLASGDSAGAMTATGNADINWAGAATINSTSSQAVQATGNATFFGGSLFTPGGTKLTGPATLTTQTPTAPGTATDPFAGDGQQMQGGIPTVVALTGSSSEVATPGVYSQLSVSGNASLALAPGIYVITGHVDISGTAKISGAGVTLYLTCANYPSSCASAHAASLNVSGNGSLTLTDGALGDNSGLVLLDDPTATTASVTTSGNAIATLTGDLDLPASSLQASGNAQMISSAGRVVVSKVSATGHAAITVEGTAQPTGSTPPPAVAS